MRLIIFFLLFSVALQSCNKGCLKCSNQNKCLFCDVSAYYVLQNGACLNQNNLNNCLQMNQDGTCLNCPLQNQFVDPVTSKCLTLEPDKIVENCILYSNNRNCSKCQTGFWLSSLNKCTSIKESMPNCIYYQSEGLCQECMEGYFPAANQKSCSQITAITKCRKYNTISCNGCTEGYFFNQNILTEILKSSSDLDQAEVSSLFSSSSQTAQLNLHNKMCQKKSMKNCLQFANAKECQKCEPNFYLNSSKQCVQNPIDRIPDCKTYLQVNICQECVNRFYLQSSTQCTAVTDIANCEDYDGSKNVSFCKKCFSGFFSTGSQCYERKVSANVQYCETVSFLEDKCEKCLDGYIIDLQGGKCLTQISNCVEHNVPSSSADSLRCELCAPGYYNNNGTGCLLSKMTNCRRQSFENICEKCVDEFYLLNGQCVGHKKIANCEKYDSFSKDSCSKCAMNFFRFSFQQVCQQNKQILQCNVYSTTLPLRCEKCNIGFFVLNDICSPIPVANCATYQNSKCTSCIQNYALNVKTDLSTDCQQILKHQQSNCKQTSLFRPENVENLRKSYCRVCNEASYPMDFSDQSVCIAKEDVTLLQIELKEQESSCTKFNNQGVCVQCMKTMFLDSQGKCVTSCTSKMHQLISYKFENISEILPRFRILGMRKCLEPSTKFMNAEIIGLDYSFTEYPDIDIIIKCLPEAFPLIRTLDKVTSFRFHNVSLGTEELVVDIVKQTPEIQKCGMNTPQSNLSVKDPNCLYYGEIEVSNVIQFKCFRCNDSFSSSLTNLSDQYFLSECKKDQECKTEHPAGIHVIWEHYFSCQICQDSSKIPFVAVQMINSNTPFPTNYQSFTLKSIDRVKTPDLILKTTFCLSESALNLGYNVNNADQMKNYQSLPLNCALGVINLSLKNGNSIGNQSSIPESQTKVELAHFCAACKQGFKPTYLNTFMNHIVVKCLKIVNCLSSRWFNNCSQCQNGFAYSVQSDGRINFDECNSTTIANCYAVNSFMKCEFCNKGYQLNLDSQCEQLRPPFCSEPNKFILPRLYKPFQFNIAVQNDHEGQGCNQCDSGYVGMVISSDDMIPYICTKSSYLQASTQMIAITNYIKNCKSYGLEEKTVICQECQSNFVLNRAKTFCFSGPVGCLISIADNTCELCLENRYIIGGKCEDSRLAHCKVPENSKNSLTKAICRTCEMNYYLTQDLVCNIGKVANCLSFLNFNPEKCEICADGYVLIRKNPLDLCQKIPLNTNCKNGTLENSSISGAIFKCTNCLQPYDTLTQDNVQQSSHCIEFESISNCASYQTDESLEKSSFLCLSCNNGFFLTDNGRVCTARSKSSTQCESYSPTSDVCEKCADGYFTNSSGLCEVNPVGIPYCHNYIDENNCEICKENFYLDNNQCVKLDGNTTVNNCQFYQNQNYCLQCYQSYVQESGKCVKAEAQKCLTYLNANTCETCEKNHILIEKEGITSCHSKIIPNCLKIDVKPNYLCLQCAMNYYINAQGECSAARSISNCVYYSGQTTCETCTKGYTLSQDGLSCIALGIYLGELDKNCSDYRSQVECAVCQPGFYLKNRMCIACQDLDKCLFCDPDNSSICLMCNTNSYMISNGKCVSNTPVSSKGDEILVVVMMFIFLVI